MCSKNSLQYLLECGLRCENLDRSFKGLTEVSSTNMRRSDWDSIF